MENIITSQNLATVAMALLMAYVLYRSRTPEILRGELEASRIKCERLEGENEQFKTISHDKDVQIADLKARTDLTDLRQGQAAILKLISKQNASAMETQTCMNQMVTTLRAMEKRLDQGLVMGGNPRG